MKIILSLILAIIVVSLLPIETVAEENTINYTAYRQSCDPIIRADTSQQNCLDEAVLFARNNSDYFFVIMSPDPEFRHQPHMANCQINGDTLIIYDIGFNFRYKITISNESMIIPYHLVFPESFDDAWGGETYLHFVRNETDIIRNYISITDNRNDYFDYENVSSLEVNTFVQSDSSPSKNKIYNNTNISIPARNELHDIFQKIPLWLSELLHMN
jgi:hypothetical protein